jgi:hypothetical protein
VKGSYKIPQITLTNYSGPTRAQGAPTSDSILDAYRFGLEQFASITAGSLNVPTVTVAMNAVAAGGTGEITYSGLTIRNINRGKIDTAKVDRVVVTFNAEQPRPAKFTAELSDLTIDDFDANVVIAAFDPAKANDDSYHRAYRQISTGAYVLTSTSGIGSKISGIVVEGIEYQPSKFRPGELLALLPKDPSAPQTPAQTREMMEKVANLYEGVRVGKAAITDSSFNMPQGAAKLNAIKYSQNEFTLEGLDVPTPQGQFKMERFALKSFSAANLMRWAANLAKPGQAPSPDQMLGLFRVPEGAEIKGVVSPYKNTRKLVTIDTLSLNWGQLIGSIPSNARAVARMVVPTDPGNPAQLPLTSAGIDKLAIDLDLGAVWTESSNALVLAPATLDIGGLAKAQVRITLGNVPRGVFSLDPSQTMSQAAQIEAGAIELSLRDNGGVDLVVAQFARMQKINRDAARRAIVDMIRANREQVASANPDAGAAVDAIARFVETPGQTLAIKLTPLGKVPGMQLMQLLTTEPIIALARFRIEASTGL